MSRSNVARLMGIALLPLAAPGAQAQVLLETEGIELRGAAQVAETGAGLCRVSGEGAAAATYDVWRLDFSMRNGSGKSLDHLIANYKIASDDPPCAEWSWPAAGRYPGLIGWGNIAGLIQRNIDENPVEPGETLTDTKYLFVFGEREPRFETASVDFSFVADAPGDAPGAAPEDAPDGEPPAAVPPAEICGLEPSTSGCWREVVDQPGCYMWLAQNLDQTITWDGECSGGLAQGMGMVGLRYGPRVPGMSRRTAEGLLVDGKRQGRWVTLLASGQTFEGPFVDGLEHGHWVMPGSNGGVSEGLMLAGTRRGDWIQRDPDGTIRKGPRVADDSGGATRPQGRWVVWYPNGTIEEGSLVRSKREGIWTYWRGEDTIGRLSFFDGQRHGLSVLCFPRPGMTLVQVEIHRNDELQSTYTSLDDIPDPGLMSTVLLECARLVTLERPEPPRGGGTP